MTPSPAIATSTPAVSEQTATLKRNSEVTEATPSSSASHGMFIEWRITKIYKSPSAINTRINFVLFCYFGKIPYF